MKNEQPLNNNELLPICLKLLLSVGFIGLITIRQLVEWLSEDFIEDEIKAALEYIVMRKFIAQAKVEIKALNGMPVLYLTRSGKNYLRRHKKKLALYTVAGKPTAMQLANARKTLHLAEALVEANKTFKVGTVLSQAFLSKPKIITFFERRGAESISDASFQQCDYGVIGQERTSGPIIVKPYRLADGLSSQTLAKSASLINWFVSTERQRKRLVSIGLNAVIVNPFRKEPWSDLVNYAVNLFVKIARPVSSKLSETDKLVMTKMQTFNMTQCVDDLMICCEELPTNDQERRNKLRYSVAKLVELGLLKKRTAKVCPGTGVGRPIDYYFLPENEKHFVGKCFQRQIILGYYLRKEAANKAVNVDFDPAYPSLLIEDEEQIRIIVSDYADGERDSDVDITIKNFNHFAGRQTEPVRLAVVDYARCSKLLNKISEDRILDMGFDFYRRSRKFKDA